MFLVRACLRNGGGRGRILSGHSTPKYGSPLLAPRLSAPTLNVDADVTGCYDHRIHHQHRPFSSSSGNGGGDNDNDDDDNNLFLKDEDSLPAPPSYVRDAVTGKWTDETRARLSPGDRRLLDLDDDSRGEEVMARLEERWRTSANAVGGNGGMPGATALTDEHERVARRIQEQRLALGTVGREPADGILVGDDGVSDASEDPADPGAERPLTPREYQALGEYARKEHDVSPRDFAALAGSDDDPDLIPHNTVSSGAEGSTESKNFFDADLDLAYLNPKLARRAFPDAGAASADPFADLLPSDLNPARKVNRRNAKPIPRRLLHHNNLSLLRRYTTPGGKIMNRVQSRLGAKDQRKISKLVKRARHLGLIPHLGQWKYEDHGYLHEEGFRDVDDAPAGEEGEGKRDWEAELERRGLWPLADENEIAKRHYGVERMMDHMAGPRGSKKRKELDELLGGVGGLVPEDGNKAEEKSS